MIGWLTTARKATVSAAIAFLSPPTALLVSDQPLSWRVFLAAAMTGVIAGLSTYEVGNTEPYEPRHAARDEEL